MCIIRRCIVGQFLIDSNINWQALKTQKTDLLAVIARLEGKGASDTELAEADSLTGILHLIDNIQDNAVRSGIWEEAEVFNLHDDEG